jgi:hypothetical protein
MTEEGEAEEEEEAGEEEGVKGEGGVERRASTRVTPPVGDLLTMALRCMWGDCLGGVATMMYSLYRVGTYCHHGWGKGGKGRGRGGMSGHAFQWRYVHRMNGWMDG